MCSTPKASSGPVRVRRTGEDGPRGREYLAMLRRASERMDQRETQAWLRRLQRLLRD